jgi:hypothetical protein
VKKIVAGFEVIVTDKLEDLFRPGKCHRIHRSKMPASFWNWGKGAGDGENEKLAIFELPCRYTDKFEM